MNKTIFIDTSDNQNIIVALRLGEEEYPVSQKVDARRAQVVLPLIEKLLQEHSLSLREITHIEVNAGPGSFTGLRVGITIANTLGFLLNIPVNGKPVSEFVDPVYS